MHRLVLPALCITILQVGLVTSQLQPASDRQALFSLPYSQPLEDLPFHEKQDEKIITETFSHYVEHLMDIWHAKGVAVSVVRPDGDVEFGSWGLRTEDGDRITPDVSIPCPLCLFAIIDRSALDSLQHRIVLKSVSVCFTGDFDGPI